MQTEKVNLRKEQTNKGEENARMKQPTLDGAHVMQQDPGGESGYQMHCPLVTQDAPAPPGVQIPTLLRSMVLLSMRTALLFCSQAISQKWPQVLGRGPWKQQTIH